MKNISLLFTLFLLSHNFLFAQPEIGSFEFEGRTRNYEVYLPQNFHANMPVVFVLHGYTQSISQIKGMSGMHNAADTMGFITVYPESASISWNTGETKPPNWQMYDTTVNDVGFISALIDTIDSHFNIDLNRIYVCGFSSGGEMTFRLIAELGHRFAAAASVSGPLNEVIGNIKPIRPYPIFHMHGTSDPYISYTKPYLNLWSVEKTLNYWIDNNGCSLPADTIPLFDNILKIDYSNCINNNIVVHYKFMGGGHEWPSSPINASAEILNFFKEYTNPLPDYLAFGKSLKISHKFFPLQGDTLIINAELSNPENHSVTSYAYIKGIYSGFKDSVELFDDGLHSDGNASDNIWGGTKWLSNLEEDFFVVEGYTKDITAYITLSIPTRVFFTTAGPLQLDSVSSKINAHGLDYYELKSFVRNKSDSLIITGATIQLTCKDPWVFSINSYEIHLPEMAPGETVESDSRIIVSYIDSIFSGYFNLKAKIKVHHWASWNDSIRIVVKLPDDVDDEISIPLNFDLSQNYPNPFNPSTTFKYSIPTLSKVIIKVYDILGKEVITLVNEEKQSGTYEVEFNSHSGLSPWGEVRNLPSGVYFYQLSAVPSSGSGQAFVETKKMILLR